MSHSQRLLIGDATLQMQTADPFRVTIFDDNLFKWRVTYYVYSPFKLEDIIFTFSSFLNIQLQARLSIIERCFQLDDVN